MTELEEFGGEDLDITKINRLQLVDLVYKTHEDYKKKLSQKDREIGSLKGKLAQARLELSKIDATPSEKRDIELKIAMDRAEKYKKIGKDLQKLLQKLKDKNRKNKMKIIDLNKLAEEKSNLETSLQEETIRREGEETKRKALEEEIEKLKTEKTKEEESDDDDDDDDGEDAKHSHPLLNQPKQPKQQQQQQKKNEEEKIIREEQIVIKGDDMSPYHHHQPTMVDQVNQNINQKSLRSQRSSGSSSLRGFKKRSEPEYEREIDSLKIMIQEKEQIIRVLDEEERGYQKGGAAAAKTLKKKILRVNKELRSLKLEYADIMKRLREKDERIDELQIMNGKLVKILNKLKVYFE